jgi:class 3 adenylate cyclase
MFNLGALDVVISLVVVLILLSLVVQSLQQFVKKVWKLKSRVLLRSLEDLLGRVVKSDAGGAGNGSTPVPEVARDNSLWARLARVFGRVGSKDTAVTELVDELKELGRRSLFNRPMLDSIAKDDVVKVMTRLGAAKIFQERFEQIQGALKELTETLEAARTVALQGGSSAKLASLQQTLTPLASDLQALAQGNGVLPTTVLTDLLNLRRIHIQDAFDLLAGVQDRVQKDLAAATAANQDTTGLKNVDAALRTAAEKLKLLGDKVEAAVAPLAARLNAVELWYDTVMQGFDERYTRHMKTVTVGIAILTVIALNANFFTLYGRIVSDPKLRGNLANAGQAILDERKNQETAETTATETPAPATAETPAASETPATTETPATETPVTETPETSDAASPDTSVQDVQKAGQQVSQQVQEYESLGLSRLHWSEVKRYWCLNAPWGPEKDKLGWGPWFGSGLNTLFGWLLTVLLLSTGAPFWEDVLESLFGLKGLMRKKTGTRNVETGEGGQPKP